MKVLQKYSNFFIFLIIFYLIFDKVYLKEKMSNSDIKKLIEDEYRIDVDSIRNLSKLANELTVNNKLIIPGGLEIQGPLTVSKNITANEDITVNKNLNVKKQTTLHELYGGKSSINGFRAIQINGGHIMFNVGNYGYGFHSNGYRYQRNGSSYTNNNFSGKVYVNGDLQTSKNLAVSGSLTTGNILTDHIKTNKLVPYNGNPNHNFFRLENKSDGAYLLPRANNTCGIGKSGLGLDDLYVHGHVSYN